jgi:thiol-disulfide isomerase/thioredoxin
MEVNLAAVQQRTVSTEEYIRTINQRFIERFLERRQTYVLHEETAKRIRELAANYVIVVFSAEWCKDCMANLPVLDLLSQKTGIEVGIFGKIKADPLSHTRKWRIPPSPPEIETFKIEKLPTMILFDKKGLEIGRIVEKPTLALTLEEEVYEILKKSEASKLML